MDNHARLMRHLFFVALFCGAFSGCFGGGTIGTGTGFGTKGHRAEIHFTLHGTVQDIHAKPIGDALVTITSRSGTVTRRTSAYGLFRAPLSISSGEEIVIDIEYRPPGSAKSLHYSRSQQISPAGASEVNQTIIVDNR